MRKSSTKLRVLRVMSEYLDGGVARLRARRGEGGVTTCAADDGTARGHTLGGGWPFGTLNSSSAMKRPFAGVFRVYVTSLYPQVGVVSVPLGGRR